MKKLKWSTSLVQQSPNRRNNNSSSSSSNNNLLHNPLNIPRRNRNTYPRLSIIIPIRLVLSILLHHRHKPKLLLRQDVTWLCMLRQPRLNPRRNLHHRL